MAVMGNAGDCFVDTVERSCFFLTVRVPAWRGNYFLRICYFIEEDMMLKRPRSRLLMMSCSVVAMLMLLLSACGPSGTPTTTNPGSGTPVKGGTWIDDIPNEPGSLIPNADSQTFDVVVEQALYAPLFVGTYD